MDVSHIGCIGRGGHREQHGGGLRPPLCPLRGQKGGKPPKFGILKNAESISHATSHPRAILKRGDPPLFFISCKSRTMHQSSISTPSGCFGWGGFAPPILY